MRKLLTSGAVAVGMLLASCTPANRVVENPLIGAANTMTLDFPNIEMIDTATVLHVDAYFRPHNWIRIDAGTYLLADGQKYMLQGSEGILPDSLFWMPDSGEASFVLKFGPLPRGTKSFDFIESDCDDCFKLYGVDLTGKKEYPRYPEGLPRALRKAPEDGPVPEPILAVGTTTVNVRLLGYRRGMVRKSIRRPSTPKAARQPCDSNSTVRSWPMFRAARYSGCAGLPPVKRWTCISLWRQAAGPSCSAATRNASLRPGAGSIRPGRMRISMRWWMRAAAAVSA